MWRTRRTIGSVGCGLGILAAFLGAPTARAETSRVLVLPLADRVADAEARRTVLHSVEAALSRRGLPAMAQPELRNLLRAERIRAIGELGRVAADTLYRRTGVERALLGSVDLYDPERSGEIQVSLRVLDLPSGHLLAATTEAASWAETVAWFGRERHEAFASQVDRVVDRAIERLLAALITPTPGPRPRERLVLVPFDDLEERGVGARIVESKLLAALLDAGYDVVEPGFVRELQLRAGRIERGGVGGQGRRLLAEALQPRWFLTGEVDRFVPVSHGGGNGRPELSLGIRRIDAGTGRLSAALEIELQAEDGAGLLRRAGAPTTERLLDRCAQRVLRWMGEAAR